MINKQDHATANVHKAGRRRNTAQARIQFFSTSWLQTPYDSVKYCDYMSFRSMSDGAIIYDQASSF